MSALSVDGAWWGIFLYLHVFVFVFVFVSCCICITNKTKKLMRLNQVGDVRSVSWWSSVGNFFLFACFCICVCIILYLYYIKNTTNASLPSGRCPLCQLVELGGPGLGNVNGVQVPQGCLFFCITSLTFYFLLSQRESF